MAIVGIDTDTLNSAAAVLCSGRPVIIPSAEGISPGGKAFPSYAAITKDGQKLLGEPARRGFIPEQLPAFLLQKIKQDTENFMGEAVDRAVVTAPAYLMITSATPPGMPALGWKWPVREGTHRRLTGLCWNQAGKTLRIAEAVLGTELNTEQNRFGQGATGHPARWSVVCARKGSADIIDIR